MFRRELRRKRKAATKWLILLPLIVVVVQADTVLNFEPFTDRISVTDQVPGLTFTITAVLSALYVSDTPWVRRSFLGAMASVLARPAVRNEPVYLFRTKRYEIRLTLEFYDHYASSSLNFQERSSHRDFCLSRQGEQDRDCLRGFTGSLAVARYRIQPNGRAEPVRSLREYVRSIDRSESVLARPDFERVIELQQGLASDLQVFGYTDPPSRYLNIPGRTTDQVWRLFRQDLYLPDQTTPFLILHWKHTLSAIRVLDIIPGDGTWPVLSAQQKR